MLRTARSSRSMLAAIVCFVVAALLAALTLPAIAVESGRENENTLTPEATSSDSVNENTPEQPIKSPIKGFEARYIGDTKVAYVSQFNGRKVAAVSVYVDTESNSSISRIVIPQDAQVISNSDGVEISVNEVTFKPTPSVYKFVYLTGIENSKLEVKQGEEVQVVAVDFEGRSFEEINNDLMEEYARKAIAFGPDMNASGSDVLGRERASSLNESSGPVSSDSLTDEQKKIIQLARYDIKSDPGRFPTEEWMTDLKAEQQRSTLRTTAHGKIDKTGQYVIWVVRIWHDESNGYPQNIYLGFTPGAGTEEVVAKEMVTVSPFHHMETLYNLNKDASRAGYANVNDQSFNKFGQWNDEIKNEAFLWRAYQDSEGIAPVRAKQEIEYKIRTKITDHTAERYTLKFKVYMSYYGMGAVTRIVGNHSNLEGVANVQGKGQNVILDLGSYPTQNKKIDCYIQNQYVLPREELQPSLQNCEIDLNKKRNTWRVPRYDDKGVPQHARLVLKDNNSIENGYNLQRANANEPYYVLSKSHNIQMAEMGDPFGDTRSEVSAKIPLSGNEGTDISASGRYSEDGKKIIWTVKTKHHSKTTYARQRIWVSFDENQTSTAPSCLYWNAYSQLQLSKTDIRKQCPDGPGDLEKMANWPRYAGEREVKAANGITANDEIIHVFVTDIKKDSEEYRLHVGVDYLKTEYDTKGVLYEFVTPKLIGKRIRPIATPRWLDKLDAEVQRDVENMHPKIYDMDNNLVANMNWDNTKGVFVSDTALPTFCEDTTFTCYGQRQVYRMDMDFNSAMKDKWQEYIEYRNPYGLDYGVTLMNKEQIPEDRYGFVWVDPLNFEFKNASEISKKYDYRFKSDLEGHYANVTGYWRLPIDAKPGDEFSMQLPSVINIKAPEQFDILLEDNTGKLKLGYSTPVASCTINPSNETVTCRVNEEAKKYGPLSGKFEIAPVIASIWDLPIDYRRVQTPDVPTDQAYDKYAPEGIKERCDNYGTLLKWCQEKPKTVAYNTTYKHVNGVEQYFSWESTAAIRYLSDWSASSSKYNTVKKEEFAEDDNTITYGIIANRSKMAKSGSVDFWDSAVTDGWGFTPWHDAQVKISNNPIEFVKIYAIPSVYDVKHGVAREYLNDDNLIWPINEGTKAGYDINVQMYTSGGKPGIKGSINKNGGYDKPDTYVILIHAEKRPYYTAVPQRNKADVRTRYDSNSAEVGRYPTYAVASARSGNVSDNTSKIRIYKDELGAEGRRNAQDNPMTGALFRLYKQGDYQPDNPESGLLAKAVTDAMGELIFYGPIPAGNYTIVEQRAPKGYQGDGYKTDGTGICEDNEESRPMSSVSTVPLWSTTISSFKHNPCDLWQATDVEIVGKHTAVTKTIWNSPGATLGDRLWFDDNKDGHQNANERELPSDLKAVVTKIKAELYSKDNKKIASTNLDENGYYRFSRLMNGEYKVRFVFDDAAVQTLVGTGNKYTLTEADKCVICTADGNPAVTSTQSSEATDSDAKSIKDTPLIAETNYMPVKYRPVRSAFDNDSAEEYKNSAEELDNPNFDIGLVASTPTEEGVPIVVRKQGYTLSETEEPVNLPGALFELHSMPGQGGEQDVVLTKVTCGDVLSESDASAPRGRRCDRITDNRDAAEFISSKLIAGMKYKLTEVKAPEGRQLLAQPIVFELVKTADAAHPYAIKIEQSSDSKLSLTDRVMVSFEESSSSMPRITIRDVEIGHLPASGGHGLLISLTIGGLVLLFGTYRFRKTVYIEERGEF